jgi:hypothetical protein
MGDVKPSFGSGFNHRFSPMAVRLKAFITRIRRTNICGGEPAWLTVVKTGILNDIKHRDSMKCEGQHPQQTF